MQPCVAVVCAVRPWPAGAAADEGRRPRAGTEAAGADRLQAARALSGRADGRRRRATRPDPIPDAHRRAQAEGRHRRRARRRRQRQHADGHQSSPTSRCSSSAARWCSAASRIASSGGDTIVPAHEHAAACRSSASSTGAGRAIASSTPRRAWPTPRSACAPSTAPISRRCGPRSRRRTSMHGAAPSTGTYRNLATGDEGKRALEPYPRRRRWRARQARRSRQDRRRGRRGQRTRHLGRALRQARALRRLSRQAARFDLHGRRRHRVRRQGAGGEAGGGRRVHEEGEGGAAEEGRRDARRDDRGAASAKASWARR